MGNRGQDVNHLPNEVPRDLGPATVAFIGYSQPAAASQSPGHRDAVGRAKGQARRYTAAQQGSQGDHATSIPLLVAREKLTPLHWEFERQAMKAEVRSFLIAYRWELWLIIGIPVMAGISHSVTGFLGTFLIPNAYAASSLVYVVGGVVTLLLLAVSYLRVRNFGRDFLTVLWGYVLAASVILTTGQGVLFLMSAVFPTDDNFTVIGRNLSVLGVAFIPEIAVLLWFARRASRLSLTHAFFLLVYSSLNLLGSVSGHTTSVSNTSLILVYVLAGAAIGLTVALTKVWLLGNFERRGPRFRRDAVAVLLATLILGGYAKVAIADLLGFAEGPYLLILPLLGAVYGSFAFIATTAFELAFLGVFFALVYLVRVRPSAAETEPEPETVAEETGEEH